MKKTVLATLVLTLSFLAPVAKAQEFNFDRAYQDYLYSRGVYDRAHSDYTKARDFYLTNQTLTLKEDARKKTLTMLKERDQLEIVYLTTLRIKILEITGLTGDERGNIFGKIDQEIGWYKIHKDNYKDGDLVEDLFNKSDEAKSRHKNQTLPLIYESLFTISFGEEKTIIQEQENIYASLRDAINEGVERKKLDMNPFNRWFSDIDSVIKNLAQNDTQAKTQIGKIYSQSFSPLSAYNTSLNTLSASIKLIGQLNQFLIEVATSIRNQL